MNNTESVNTKDPASPRRLRRNTRLMIVIALLVNTLVFYQLVTFKEGWEMGEEMAFILCLGAYLYYIILLVVSLLAKQRGAMIALIVLALLPPASVVLLICGLLVVATAK